MTSTGYRRTVLDTGLRVISEKMPYLKSVAVGIWVDVGSRNESPKENGSSHFVEHMCFKGTERRSAKEIAHCLESLGGTLNAFTARENTCYYARVLGEHFEIGFDVLADILTQSLFDKVELEKEKDVICEEIKDVYDTPADVVHDYFAAAVWDSHPLGQTIMGEAKNIRKFKRSELLSFIRSNYTTDRIVVAAAGAVDHDRLVELARQQLTFGQPDSRHALIAPRYEAGERKIIARKLSQTHVCLGFPSIPFDHPRRHAVLLLNALLGGGMASRLFQSVREERGLAYTVYSYQDFYHDTGLFGVYLGTDNNKMVDAVSVVLQEIAAVKTDAISKEEVEHCKSQLKGNLLLALEGSYSRMNRLARLELYQNTFIPPEVTAAAIDAVSLDEVREAAREIFQGKMLTMVAMGPIDKKLTKRINWSILDD